VEQYLENGWDFVLTVVGDPLKLEDISGISKLKSDVEDNRWELESCEDGE
jgi:hypothetical protein